MKYISAQPDSDYFIWQLRVQMNNFRKHGIEKDAIILLSTEQGKEPNPNAAKFLEETKATVIFFPDRRNLSKNVYIPSIANHLLKEFFRNFGMSDMMEGQDFLFHDADILFSSIPDFKVLSKKKKILVSDTISYIGAKYIVSKGNGLLEEMCAIVGIDPQVVIKNEKKSGGAQYFIPKNIPMDFTFWDKVENDSVNLYMLMIKTSNKYTPSHPIQSWTAGMWALLWNFWLYGHDTIVSKELDFSWPTFAVEDWDKYHIFHNAGVTADRKDLFFKGEFTVKSPFTETHDNVNNKFCSIKYVEEIIETGKNFLNLKR